MNLTGLTAEDAEEQKRIEKAEIIKRADFLTNNKESELDNKDELIRKLITEIELHVEIDFESWAKRGDVELSDEEINELLRIKNKQ